MPVAPHETDSERISGTVKWFNDAKGYGFLVRDDGGDDVFVHFSRIAGPGTGRKSLVEHSRVTFTIGKGTKGKPEAVDVRSA